MNITSPTPIQPIPTQRPKGWVIKMIIQIAVVAKRPKVAVIGNSLPLTFIFHPTLKGLGKFGSLARSLSMDKWAKAKQSKLPKTYRPPRLVKKAVIEDSPGSNNSIARKQSIKIEI